MCRMTWQGRSDLPPTSTGLTGAGVRALPDIPGMPHHTAWQIMLATSCDAVKCKRRSKMRRMTWQPLPWQILSAWQITRAMSCDAM